jgi:hypothetical protein
MPLKDMRLTETDTSQDIQKLYFFYWLPLSCFYYNNLYQKSNYLKRLDKLFLFIIMALEIR